MRTRWEAVEALGKGVEGEWDEDGGGREGR